MKLKKTLPVIALATLMGVGVFSGIKQNATRETEIVSAIEESTPDYYYVNFDRSAWSPWATFDNGKITMHCWDQNSPSPNNNGALVDGHGLAVAEEIVTGPDGRTYGKFAKKFTEPTSGKEMNATHFVIIYESVGVADHQTANVELIPGQDVLYISGDWGNTMTHQWGTYKFSELGNDVNFKLYDSSNYFEEKGAEQTAKYYAWSPNNIAKDVMGYPGLGPTTRGEKTHGGRLYEYSFKKYQHYNMCIFNGGGTDEQANMTKTSDLFIQPNQTYVYNKNNKSGEWVSNGKWVSNEDFDDAIDFVYDKMKMDTYDPELTGKGDGSCKDYYQDAKTAYQGLTDDAKEAITIIDNNVWERLSAWAEENSDSFNKDSGFASTSRFGKTSDNSAMPYVIIIISSLSILAMFGLILGIAKKSKETK